MLNGPSKIAQILKKFAKVAKFCLNWSHLVLYSIVVCVRLLGFMYLIRQKIQTQLGELKIGI